MKTKPNPFITSLANRLTFVVITTAAILYSQSAFAATTVDWSPPIAGSGGTAAWATGGNWVGGNSPTSDLTTNVARFNQPSYNFQPNAGTTSIAGIQVGDGVVSTGALTITATSLSLGDSGVLVSASAGAVNIGAVKIGASQNWQNNSSSLLTFSSTVGNVGDLAPFTVTLNGSGSGGTTITGVVSNGGTTGTTGINVNTSSGITSLNAANTFTGGLNIQRGTVKLGNAAAAGAGLVTIGNTGTSGVLDLNGASRTINSLATAGTASSQKITNSAAGTATLNLTGAATSNFGGVIENGSGTTALTLNNAAASLTLSGANTYTGVTTLTAGSITLGNKTAFGGSSLVSFNGVATSANTDLNGANAIANAWSFTTGQTFQGSSSLELAGAVTTGASKALNNNIVSGKSLTLSNSSILIGANSATSSTLTLAGTGDTVVSGNLVNNVTGAGTSGLTYTGSGSLTLSGAGNTYSGATIVGVTNTSTAGTLKLSGSGALGAGAVTVFTGTLDINSLTRTLGSTLTLGGGAAGTSAAVAIGASGALTLGGNVTFTATNNPNGAIISGQTLNLGVPRTFTVNDSTNATTDLTVSAAIGDGNGIFDVTKAGTGAMTYTPNIAITGTPTLNVNAGTLLLSGTVSGGNGIFDITKAGAGTLIYASNIVLASNQTLNLGTGSTILSGAISGGFGIAINGTGSLTLGGATANAATSALTVNSGNTLIFDSGAAGAAGTTRAGSVTLRGASLNVLGNAALDSNDTITGALTFDAPSTFGGPGANTVTITPDPATTVHTQLTAGSLVRANGGVAFFRGTDLGLNTIASATPVTSSIAFTSDPTPQLVGGNGGAGSQNIKILPWAVGSPVVNGTPSSFVTYDANGIRPLGTGEYDTAIPAAASTNNVKLSAASPATANGAATINSLFLNNIATSTIVLAGTGALTVTSGAIYADLSLGGNNNVLTIGKLIEFGAGEGIIGTSGTANSKTLSFTGGISGTGGLTIYDASIVSSTQAGVNIGSATTYTGNTIINGSLIAADANAIPNATGGRTGDVYVYGSFGVNGSVRINGLFGTGRVSNPFSTFRTLFLGDNNATSTFDGTFSSSNLNLAKMGTGTLNLTGTNSAYTGATAVQNGAVSVVTLNNISSPNATSGLGRPTTVTTGTISLGNLATTGQLTVTGTGETTDRVISLAGRTGGAVIDQSGTGLLKFTSDLTAPGVNSTDERKTLTLQGSTAGTGEISGAIVDSVLGTTNQKATSVVKAGTGTWTLSGVNSYSGSTTVNGGTLSLGAATLNDASIVDVASTAVLNLSHGQTDVVAEFRINGVAQGNGTFNASNTGGRITGSGSLQVGGVVADPFSTWIALFPSLTGPNTAKGADPDNDGMTNYVEFALDGNPASGAATGKVRSQIETVGADQALVITLPVRAGAVFDNIPGPAADATIDNLIYTIAGSNDLASFNQGVTEVAVSSSGMPALSSASWTYRTFRLNGAIGGGTPRGPKGFLRAGITSTP